LAEGNASVGGSWVGWEVLAVAAEPCSASDKLHMKNKLMIYINGKFVQENKAMVSIFDRGFLFGDGAFETMRAYSSKVFKLDEHIKRLFYTLKALGIKPPSLLTNISFQMNTILKQNKLKDAYIRAGVTRGASGGGFEIVKKIKPTFYIIARPFKPYPESWYNKGVKAAIVSIRKIPSSSFNSKLKTHNLLPNILARIEARKKGAFEGILLDENGYICEGAVSNIFFVKDSMLLTPSVQNDILSGITRQTVIGLAKELGIKVREGKFKTERLFNCNGCFLTNSLMEIMPVRMVSSLLVGNGKPDIITKALISSYRDIVKRDKSGLIK